MTKFLARVTSAVRRKFLVQPAVKEKFLLKREAHQQEALPHQRSLLPTHLMAQATQLTLGTTQLW
jgi:hypothetical protein